MGVALSELVTRQEIALADLAGKKIAIDALNTIFQFLAIIRDRFTGQPLRDHEGRVTSHLSGLLYRTLGYLEGGVQPVYVFDGPHPDFKAETVARRHRTREKARRKWEEAVQAGEPALRYAQAATRVDDDILGSSVQLLDLMGVPWVQAPSEGEAQCAWMCKQRLVFATASQDFDSLLFGTPRLVRNLSASGKRKLAGKSEYVDVKPELIELSGALDELGLTREQLIIVGLLIGTDYNRGARGIGPKKGLRLVKDKRRLQDALEAVEFVDDVDVRQVYDFFLHPPHTDTTAPRWQPPDTEQLFDFLVAEHDFLPARMEKAVQRLTELHPKRRGA
jgi:flap endonuclease-1